RLRVVIPAGARQRGEPGHRATFEDLGPGFFADAKFRDDTSAQGVVADVGAFDDGGAGVAGEALHDVAGGGGGPGAGGVVGVVGAGGAQEGDVADQARRQLGGDGDVAVGEQALQGLVASGGGGGVGADEEGVAVARDPVGVLVHFAVHRIEHQHAEHALVGAA